MKTQKEKTDYKRAFNEAKYDRIAVTVPKGRRKALEAFAKQNKESVNRMTNRLYMAEMGLTEAEWKGGASDE